MKRVVIAIRILMAAPLLVFGANGFFHFFEIEQRGPQAVEDFLTAMQNTGFLFQLVCGTHILTGIFLLVNRLVPLALILHAPVTLNIVLLHAFLDPQSGMAGFVLAGLHLILFVAYYKSFLPLISPRTKFPAGA